MIKWLVKAVQHQMDKKRIFYLEQKRRRLTNTNFTLLSNNCIAGVIYHNLGLKFDSPTINLFFPSDTDFIRYVNHLKEYSSCELIEKKDCDCRYPIGVLVHEIGNIQLHFMHYKSFEEAALKWKERSNRIHFDNIYVIFEAGVHTSSELLDSFETISYQNKVVFTNGAYPCHSAYTLKIYNKKYCSGKILLYKRLSKKRYLDAFDYVEFLNSGIIRRSRN